MRAGASDKGEGRSALALLFVKFIHKFLGFSAVEALVWVAFGAYIYEPRDVTLFSLVSLCEILILV